MGNRIFNAELFSQIVVIASLAQAAMAFPVPSFMGLGDLPGGPDRSASLAVSQDGATVVGIANNNVTSPEQGEAFRWDSSSGMVGLGFLPGGSRFSTATGVSANGQVIIGASDSASANFGPTEAFRWTAETGMMSLGDLPGGNFDSRAEAVSGDGSVIVGRGSTGLGNRAFRWTQATGMLSLGDLPGGGSQSEALGVSLGGNIIVGRAQSAASGFSRYEACFWTQPGVIQGLGDLPGGDVSSSAFGVSGDGSVVVGWGSVDIASFEAFRWTQATGMVSLGDLPGGNHLSIALAGNIDGTIIVGSGSDPSGFVAMMWDSLHGMRDFKTVLEQDYGLDLSGWRLSSASGISPDGNTIVGVGTDPSGAVHAWRAIIPEPTTLILSLATIGIGYFRRHRREPDLLGTALLAGRRNCSGVGCNAINSRHSVNG